MFGGALAGMHVAVVHPPGYGPDPDVTATSRELAAASGGRVDVTTELDAVEGAQVVATDVWTSMGQEDEAEARRSVFRPYQVDRGLVARAAPGAIVLHCLPAHRGEEIT